MIQTDKKHTPARKYRGARRPRELFDFHPDVKATLATNPDDFSPITSKSRISSYRYALAGWLWMLKTQKNIRIQAVVSVTVFVVGLWLQLDPLSWALLVMAITLNWVTEFINAAIESAINLASPTIHPVARVGKDVAAATVLLTSVSAAIIGGLIMGPPLLSRLAPLIIQILRGG